MKIYLDSELTQEVEFLDLGIVQAGDTKEYTFWVYNDTEFDVKNLVFNLSHPEVKIIQSPINLDAKQSDKFIVQWKSSVTLEKSLKPKIKISGMKLIPL